MGMVCISGPTEASIRVIGTKTRFQDTESIIGMMVEHIKAIGWTIICMDKESTSGLTAENMKVSM